jgi:protein-disulfide isomerase-like protein with CxxC motif
MGKTWKQKFNEKYNKGEDINKSNTLSGIAKATGIKKSIIQEVYNRGVGAHKSSLGSVRLKKDFSKNPNTKKFPASARLTKEQWGYARVYGFVMNNPKQVGKDKPDRDLKDKI